MKVKLIKVSTISETLSWNYGDDYSDVVRHIADTVSDWEEIDPNDLHRLEYFVQESNIKGKGHYYLLVTDQQPMTCQMAIKEMMIREKERMAELKRQEEERRQKADKLKQENVLKRKSQLEKKLKKLQEELKNAS